MVTEVAFSSWDEFRLNWRSKIGEIQENMFRSKSRPGTKYRMSKLLLFRGQAMAQYPLRSAFDRIMESHGLGRNHYIENRFSDFIDQFINARVDAGVDDGAGNFFGALSAGIAPNRSMLDMAAIAQHNGLPTRLLDWSRSPYVAAFFAFVNDQPPTGDAAIWCMDAGRINDEACVKKTDVTIWNSHVNGNPRQLAQQGAFSLNITSEVDLETVLDLSSSRFMHRDPQTEILFRLSIPRTERSKVLDDLNLMRIDHLSLFPDEDGVIRHMKWRLSEKEFSDPDYKPLPPTK